MTKHTIDIEDLPEGWEATKVEVLDAVIVNNNTAAYHAIIKLKKTKPREIKFVETGEIRQAVKGEYVERLQQPG